MLKLLSAVVLLAVASGSDAAPLGPGEPSDGDEVERSTVRARPPLRTKPMTTFPYGDGELDSATGRPDVPHLLKTSLRTEKNRRFVLEKRDKAVTTDHQSGEDLMKMLIALEELHKLMNNTLSHRITFITRGNSNGRSTGKKNKTVVTEGNLKSTTATTIDSGGLSPKASTDQTDPKLTGKAFKKTLASAKKTNKRVCFWKYCSQN